MQTIRKGFCGAGKVKSGYSGVSNRAHRRDAHGARRGGYGSTKGQVGDVTCKVKVLVTNVHRLAARETRSVDERIET